eukprot:SAG31_NODE_29185_length_399_cov_1.033333_1_plen_45_part_10
MYFKTAHVFGIRPKTFFEDDTARTVGLGGITANAPVRAHHHRARL